MLEPRLRELDMGVLEKRHIDTLTERKRAGVARW
jgi:probable phosphoglycerate mutase